MTSSPDLTMAAVKMMAALALMLVLLWGLQRLTRRKLPFGRQGVRTDMIRVLENRYLGVKKSIALVQIPGSVLVLGLGSDRINLLDRIDDPQLIAGLDAKPAAGKPSAGFWSHFSRAVSAPGLRGGSASRPVPGFPEAD